MFQAAIDSARDAVLWIDAGGLIVYVNERACGLFGYSRHELLELRAWDLDAGLSREGWPALWTETLHEGTTETRYRRKDGTLVPVEVWAKNLEAGGARRRVVFARDVARSRAVIDALRRTQAAVDRARDAIFWIGSDARLVYVNDAACESLGYTREELLRLTVPDIDPNVSPAQWVEDWRRSREARSFVAETMHRTKSGRLVPVEVAINFMQFDGEEYNCVYTRDISERKRAEEERARLESQLLHAQKMESVGRLAGGVAHDFNNMLSVILGYTELITRSTRAGDPLRGSLEEIRKAATRSRDTTRQLLAFSRRQIIEPRPLDLNQVVAGARNALGPLIGEDIDLCFAPAGDLWKVVFDPSQIEQMLVNLVVNARDALPAGGTITIETANARIDEAYCREHAEAAPGDFVVLTVADSGVGMDRETLAHIFEPFFSTKGVGKGTGLGLATVYGAVKQNHGFISVRSEPGRGSTFKLFIPRMKGESAAQPRIAPESPAARGRGTILVVEDDEAVRGMTQSMLEALGYTVLTAATPRAALALCARQDPRIDLLFTDVVMPEMKGPDLWAQVHALRPEVGVLFMSGYTANAVVAPGGIAEGAFLPKPFTLPELSTAIESVLARRPSAVAGGARQAL